MNILDAIVEHKRVEVLKRKGKRPLNSLKEFPYYKRSCNQISGLSSGSRPGIIAEFKRSSPSKGLINGDARPLEVARGYKDAGVHAMSILTDRNFFGGSFHDLSDVREGQPDLALLRKDFIIDSYQLHEAKAYGADLILLIAAILEKEEVAALASEAGDLGLQVLFEVHNRNELKKYHPAIELVGVNNRDLKSFRVDTSTSLELLDAMPPGVIPVSESGLGDPQEVIRLHQAGYKLFLMGEAFMRAKNPGKACQDFIIKLGNNEG